MDVRELAIKLQCTHENSMWAHVAHLPSMIKSNSLSLRETVSKKGFILDAIPNSHFKLDLSAF